MFCFFPESVLRFCFNIISLMLSRLYSIREDYLNVSNVDLYYTSNSQVYVGLFLLFFKKKITFDTVKNLSFGKIKNNTVLTKSVVFAFYISLLLHLLEALRDWEIAR